MSIWMETRIQENEQAALFSKLELLQSLEQQYKRKQGTITFFWIELEYKALMKATKETKWLQDLLRELEVSYNSHVLLQFRELHERISKKSVYHCKMKHFAIHLPYVQHLTKKEKYKFSKSHLLNNQQIMFWVLTDVLEKSKFIHYKHLMWLKSLEGNTNQEIKNIPHGDQQSKLCSIYSEHFSRANICNLRNLDVPPPARLGWAPTRVWRHSADVFISVNHRLDKSLNGSNLRYGEVLRSRGNMCWRVISDLAVRETGDQAPHCSLHSRQS